MTPAEFEQEAAFLAELEDYLKAKGDSEGLLLAIKAHAQLQLMIDSDDEPPKTAVMTSNTNAEGILQYAVDHLLIERDELRAKVERHERRFRETEAEWVERFEALEAEVERLRAALIAGRATHGELCQAGAECQFIRDANAALARPKE
jgi:hypothetical protein